MAFLLLRQTAIVDVVALATVPIIGIRSFRQSRCPCHRLLSAICYRCPTSPPALVVQCLFVSLQLVRTCIRVSVHMPHANPL